MGWQLLIGCVAVAAVVVIGSERRAHQVQHGSCSYTFLLPEEEHCGDLQVTNSLQRDTPTHPGEHTWKRKRLEALETLTENNTQWLQKVLNHTSRLEAQLQQCFLSTSGLERLILEQNQELQQLKDKSRLLEEACAVQESRHAQELRALQLERMQLEQLQERQSRLVAELGIAARNHTLILLQQADLTDTLQQLLATVAHGNEISGPAQEGTGTFRDCSEIFKSGIKESGVYSLQLPNSSHALKVFCDMESDGGGWTVLQHRQDGSVDFHRTWRDYKRGFGDPSGEYWAGNDFIHQLTASQEYTLGVQLRDSEGNKAYSLYEHFHIDGEDKNYSLHVRGFSGTAGRTTSLAHSGTSFSTKDRDNDHCSCKCAQLATGGWWFEACGPSNLNGVFYAGSSSILRYNGIKWYYWKGPSMVAAVTTMMVRPVDF